VSRHHELIKNDPRWKQARADCLDRDGHTCVGFDGAGQHVEACQMYEQLQADHIVPLEERFDLAFELDNLQTLSQACHAEKGRQRAAGRLVRNTWLNPRYPELSELIGAEKQNETPVF
jgi:5-methylcytosine-specific restriction endonuclease McrA